MNTILELDYKHIWASANFMAQKEVRFYLNGIFVDGENIVSTDGRAMLICNMENNEDFKKEYNNGIIIPEYAINSIIRKLGKPNKLNTINKITLSKFDDGCFLLSDQLNAHEYFRNVEGRFPDYKRVDIPRPTEPPKQFSMLDPKYLIKISKISKGLNIIYPMIYFGEFETQVAYVELSKEIHCLIMPLRF